MTALALGTVQFGLPYGVAGRAEPVPDDEVRAILDIAASAGIQILDTAPAYGDIEARLGGLTGALPFEIVSKIDALPPGSVPADAAGFVERSITRSQQRLGRQLTTLLFHRADDLLGPCGDAIWAAAAAATRDDIRLGVSCYSPASLVEIRRRYPVTVGQVPGNALDQRLADPGVATELHDVEIHLRSAFLQGLLVMPTREASGRVPAAADALSAWSAWCDQQRLRPVTAALAVARGLPGVRYCVVGVDRPAHLSEIVDAWRDASPIKATDLGCTAPDVIDPRRWAAA
jgi:aryl-alcohol dehydrogenase-like predicted oxidoreductase